MPERLRAPVGVESVSGILAIAKGLFLVSGYAHFASSPSYRGMAQMAPEWKWGMLIGFVGIIQLYSMRAGVTRWRRACCLLMMGLWSFCAILFHLSNPHSEAGVTYAVLAGAQMWADRRLATDWRALWTPL